MIMGSKDLSKNLTVVSFHLHNQNLPCLSFALFLVLYVGISYQLYKEYLFYYNFMKK